MADKRCYYEVLGVSRTSDKGVISAAYRKLAIQYHPDKNPGDEEAIRKFKEAAEAYEVLADEEKRARYDRYGHAGLGGQAGHQFNDVSDIFAAFGDMFGEGLFGDLFGGGGGGKRGRRARRGGDILTRVTIDLLEAAKGVERTIKFRRHEACETCHGTGAKAGSEPRRCSYCSGRGEVIQQAGILRVKTTCPSCHGAGTVIADPCAACRGEAYVQVNAERHVTIPAGVDNGTRLRLAGEGEPSPDGGPPGDCYCEIMVREHPLFERDGQTLICRVPITFTQAALGATIEVPTLDGQESLTVPAGSQHGEVFKLRGRGMPDVRRRGAGDLLVQVTIEVPKKLTPRQSELLRELAEEEHASVSPERKSFFEKLREYILPEDGSKSDE